MRKIFSYAIFFILMISGIGSNSTSLKCVNASNGYNLQEIVFCYNSEEYSYTLTELGYSGNKFSLPTDVLALKVYNMGVGVKRTLNYLFLNLDNVVKSLEEKININSKDSEVLVESGTAVVTSEQVGQQLNKKQLYNDLFTKLIICDKERLVVELKICYVYPVVTKSQNELLTREKAYFRSFITGNNQEGRIHNIQRALSYFNGLKINPGEIISFNNIIGETTKENGYKEAKVILNGKYADDYGGGVCQAATTIYNASLEAGLKIHNVSPHSLKVGYVAGAFDAMVAGVHSDLVIENPFKAPVYFYTYATDQECGVKIFGEENEFKIVRRSEKQDFNEEQFPNVSHIYEGFLDYYKNNELIETKKIRRNKYYKLKIDNESTETVNSGLILYMYKIYNRW